MTTLKTDPIIALVDLRDYFAVKYETRTIELKNLICKDENPPRGSIVEKDGAFYTVFPELPNGLLPLPSDYNKTKHIKDLKKQFREVFNRHFDNYQANFPGASVEQYRQYSIEWLTNKIGVITKEDAKHNFHEVVQLAKVYINDVLKAETKQYGIDGILNAEQLAKLLPLMDKYVKANRPADFIAALTPEPLPPSFKRLTWIKKTDQSDPHKTALLAFITAIKGGEDATVTANDFKLFAHSRGKSIEKPKPKKDNSFRTILHTFETMISQAKGEKHIPF